MSRITAIASKKDVAPVLCSQVSRSKFRSQWSSGVAAAIYVLTLPSAGIPASAGQNETKSPQSRETLQITITTTPPKAVVVVTGTLDLGKITLADFGDVEPAKR